jgi:hypothetical protein
MVLKGQLAQIPRECLFDAPVRLIAALEQAIG